jgi:hypothetical protein
MKSRQPPCGFQANCPYGTVPIPSGNLEDESVTASLMVEGEVNVR